MSTLSLQKDSAHDQEKREKQALTERTNLFNMIKLVIKSLIESFMELGKQITDGNIQLEQFFTIMEDIMNHRLKVKRNLLRNKKEFFSLLESLHKLDPEFSNNVQSARLMPGIKTSLGRCRAWLRISLMSKKLSEHFTLIVEQPSVLGEWYEPDSIMLTEQAVITSGILQSLNAIDYTLSREGSDFDTEVSCIDFSLYLRDGNYLEKTNSETDVDSTMSDKKFSGDEFSILLDQKAYLEEMNKKLTLDLETLNKKYEESNSRTNSFKGHSESLEKKCCELTESLEALRTTVMSAHVVHTRELDIMSSDLNVERETYQHSRNTLNGLYEAVQKQLESEITIRQEIENELSSQRNLRSESEIAQKLLEKDIQEKQDTLIALRSQVTENKQTISYSQTKIQEQSEIIDDQSHKIEMQEHTCGQLSSENQNLRTDMQKYKDQLKVSQQSVVQLSANLNESEQKCSAHERDLKMEKQWRLALQSECDQNKVRMQDLTKDSMKLSELQVEHEELQTRVSELQEACTEQDIALVEMGQSLSSSFQRLSDVKMCNTRTWMQDNDTHDCQKCHKTFTMKRRRHHCRNCGGLYCATCSDNVFALAASSKPVRVCDGCYTLLLQSIPTQ